MIGRIIAFDLGTNLGVAIGDKFGNLTYVDTLNLKKYAGSNNERYKLIAFRDIVRNMLMKFPDVKVIAYERPFSRGTHATSLLFGQAGILQAMPSESTRVVAIAPTTMKKSFTGNGRASKEDVIAKAEEYVGEDYGLDEHSADAIGLFYHIVGTN